ncbi:uncharacterized protein LOC110973960 [Acanthaster planci]|uniref:Uncharacterized protein LOC110973960 n=1 Tax=Acanthaster planci TaxID=133434 RepID=A0A8B7XL82_ACAPL|nr:uncharacterized protein LOC110973960 [Acanthaster planci]
MAEIQAPSHSHCDSCYKQWCSVETVGGVSCLNINCPQECGARLHTCKMSDHLTRCPNTRIECYNRINGCPATMTRKMVPSHLVHCPAFVVQCGYGYRMDEFKRHFNSGVEHDHHCAPIIADKMARKLAAEKLAEESEYDSSIPADNFNVMSKDELAELLEDKKKKREEALKTHGSLLTKPRPKRSNDDLCKVPWKDTERLLSEDFEPIKSPTSPVDEMEVPPMSPTSPLPDSSSVPPGLETLPFPVLKHIGRFLDPRDLSALSLTSRFLRRVCASLLQECGMVTLTWDKQVDDTWVVTQKIWQFAVDLPGPASSD